MSIRYYLFIVVGLISGFVFLFSFAVESALLRSHVKEVRSYALETYEQVFEKRRDNLQNFVVDSLAKKLAQINLLLEAVSKLKPLTEWFSPSEEHKQKGTWNNAATLIQQDEWIDFLQNTAEQKLLSLLVPEKGPFFTEQSIAIEEGLSWVFVVGGGAYPEPFIGIDIPFKIEGIEEEVSLFSTGKEPVVRVLYKVDTLKNMPLPQKAQIEGSEEDVFFSLLARAIHLVKDLNLQRPDLDIPHPSLSFEHDKNHSFEKVFQGYLKERISYVNELFLTGKAAEFKEEEGLVLPEGMSFCLGEQNQVFFLQPVMGFSAPLFDDEGFLKEYPPKQTGSSVSSAAAVVTGPIENQAFFVNTAAIAGSDGAYSLLTLGVDLDFILQEVALSFRQYGFILSKGKIVLSKTPEGRPVIDQSQLEPILQEGINTNNGLFSVGGVKYLFSHVQPDPAIDLHFFFLLAEQDEFAFFYRFQPKVNQLTKMIMIERPVLALISILFLGLLLLQVSKKITNPILALVSCLSKVKRGEWEEITLPEIKLKKNNEIKILYDSFHKMLEGVKEKEKISAILNKVVSEEIAKEILKGDIKLGGEERVVTMLFADIRGFTHLTQNMPPDEVISFLNKCMTKLSGVVETHKGVIDKYMGDGLMAIYGAPVSDEQSPLHAIISALEMMDVLKKWNLERMHDALELIHIGVGIHTGAVCAGNMGARHRLNYTVIGSHVNMASRLCSAAEAEEILITEATLQNPCVKDNVQVELKGEVTLKGFDEKIPVYRVLGLKKSL